MSLDAERSIETGRTWQDLPPEPPEGDPLPSVLPAPPEPPPQQAKASYWPWALGILVFLVDTREFETIEKERRDRS